MKKPLFLILITLYALSAKLLGSATVSVVQGKPVYKNGDQVALLQKGMKIEAGWTVTTAQDELVLLNLSNGGSVVLYANSEVTIQQEEEANNVTKLKLQMPKGFAWSRLPKLNDTQAFEVETSSHTAGIRGTAFSVDAKGNGVTQVCVCEGKVYVIDGDGNDSLLNTGELVKAASGEAMSPVGDRRFLKHPGTEHRSCIQCHHGGYSRFDLYR
jgi:hypothetical protein